MRTGAPPLLPVFRSQMQVELLGLLLLQPSRTWTLEELAETLKVSTSSVHREIVRATDAGLLHRDAAQRPHTYRAAVDSPSYGPLRDLLERTVGVGDRLRLAVEGMEDVLAAAIHGSWAKGKVGPSSDIDVVVVVEGEGRDARRAIRRICRSAGRDADVSVLTPETASEMARLGSPFWRKLVNGPRVDLVGSLPEVVQT